MPRVTVDLSEAQTLEPIPDGRYSGTVFDLTGPHTGPKSKYMTAVLQITEGEHSGRRFFSNLPISGKGAGIFEDFYKKVTGEEVQRGENDQFDFDTDDLIGANVGMVMEQEEYPEGSGEFRSQVKRILRAQ